MIQNGACSEVMISTLGIKVCYFHWLQWKWVMGIWVSDARELIVLLLLSFITNEMVREIKKRDQMASKQLTLYYNADDVC